MSIKFTEDQQKAISIDGRQLLLSAAAGSGKTAVLIERIFRIITDPTLNVDVDKLLVLTFTEAAALEMKTRLLERLEKSLERNPDDDNLIKQMNLINYANISTMHSFCSKIIRNNFHMLDLDPSFKISGSEEPILLKMESMFEVMEIKYQEGRKEFHNLVEIFGNKVMDNGLVEVIEKLYNYSQNTPFPNDWLTSVVEKYNKNNYETINDITWLNIIKDYCSKNIKAAIEELDFCISLAEERGGFEKLLEGFYECKEFLSNYLNAINIDITSVYYLVQDEKIKAPHVYRGKIKETLDIEVYEKVKDLYNNNVRSVVNKISEDFFNKPLEDFAEEIFKLYPLMVELQSIVNLLDEHYTSKKREKNILDFNDLEHFALKVLVEKKEDLYVITEPGKELQQFYHEILIDEYQDTNLVQDTIINAIAKDNSYKNIFMVGDVKQSIYKFRRAKPELFMEKYLNFSCEEGNNDLRINLSQNFRSKDIVLDGINFIFTQLMSVDFGGIPYDNTAMLHLGAKDYTTENGLSTNVEYIIGDNFQGNNEEDEESVSSPEIEAKIIASKIIEMVDSNQPLLIQCGDGLKERRPVRYGDIVVLLRSLTSVSTFVNEFKKNNIPAFGSNKANYFKTLEVQTIISILQIIDNSFQDIHMVGVLHSPIYDFTPDDLLEIKGDSKEKFYNCIKNYKGTNKKLKDKINNFLNDLNRWKLLSKKNSISELLWTIYADTNYMVYVKAMENGEVRKGNLRVLHEKALNYEKTSYKDLFNFLKYIEQLERSESEISSAKSVSENENAVKIMTIHKSKGLEFPVVFVSQMGKKFNLLDERSNFVIHEDLGFSFKYFDEALRVTSDTISRLAIIKQLHDENLAEELRILYVALTRAKEKLIVTGVVKNLDKQKEKWSKFVNLSEKNIPTSYLTTCSTQLDFIMPCLMRHKNSDKFLEGKFLNNNYNYELHNYKTEFHIKVYNNKTIGEKLKFFYDNFEKKDVNINEVIKVSEDNKKIIFDVLSWQNNYYNIPSIVTISELKRKDEVKQVFEIGYDDIVKNDRIKTSVPLPKFMENKERITGAKKGSIIHKIMEFLDLHKHKTMEDVLSLTDKLVEKSILTKEEVECVSLDKILIFIETDLASRIKKSKNIFKETDFVLGIDSSELYNDMHSDKKILLHGCIDCYFEEDDHIILIDYKSDYYTENTKAQLLENYKLQMDIYKRAIENSTNKKVLETYIYLFHNNECVRL